MTSSNNQVKRLFDTKAKDWNEKYANALRGRLELFSELIRVHAERKQVVIDFGCGGGALGENLSDPAATLISIDISINMAFECKKYLEIKNRVPVVCCGDFASVKSAPIADLIICSSVIEYVHDTSRFFAEAASRMLPGGLLLASVPNRTSGLRRFELLLRPFAHMLAHIPFLPTKIKNYRDYLVVSRNWFTEEEFARSAATAGLTVREIVTYGSREGGIEAGRNGAMICAVFAKPQ